MTLLSDQYSGLLNNREQGRIHSASLEILRETGMAFGSAEAVKTFKDHGLKTSGQIVYFTDHIIENALEMAPNEFTVLARNPVHNLDFSPAARVLGPGSGAVYFIDHQGEIRASTREDFIQAAQLAQMMPQMKFCRHLFTPHDLKSYEKLFAWMMVQQILHQDKPYYLMDRNDIPLLATAFDKKPEEMRESAILGQVYGLTTVDVISPLYMSEATCLNLMAFCRAGITFSISSMPSAGCTAPCSITAAIILQNCENLGAMVLSQLISPGHPVFYGAMGGHSDMKTMISVYGGPENRRVEMAGSQMAHYYGLLSRGSAAMTDAPTADFQAGAETMFQLFSASLQSVNLLPGFGLLGSYMGGSLEKMVLDAEVAEYAAECLKPLKFGEGDLALEVIKEIGPKGNYVNHPHTFKRFKNEFYEPAVFNRQSYERWRKANYVEVTRLAHKRVNYYLDQYQRPEIDPGLEKELLKHC